jgi:hypothetical protein
MVFSVHSLPRCYKQDSQLRVNSWNNEVVVRQSPASKNMSTEAEDIVGICHQAATGEHIADWEDFMCAVVNSDLWSV